MSFLCFASKHDTTCFAVVLSLVSSPANRVFSVDFLQVNKSLQTLGLGGNEIGDEGARAIAEALKVVLGAQIRHFG